MADIPQIPGTEPANEIDAKKVVPSVTTFGFGSFALPTPKYAEAAFDVYLIVSTAFLGYIAATGLFSPEFVKEATYLIVLLITPIVKGISKLFGIKVDDTK